MVVIQTFIDFCYARGNHHQPPVLEALRKLHFAITDGLLGEYPHVTIPACP